MLQQLCGILMNDKNNGGYFQLETVSCMYKFNSVNVVLEAIWLNIVFHIKSDDCQDKFLRRILAKINCLLLFDRLTKYSNTILHINHIWTMLFCSPALIFHVSLLKLLQFKSGNSLK